MRGRLAFIGYLFASFVAGFWLCAYLVAQTILVTVSEPGEYTISRAGNVFFAIGRSTDRERRIECEFVSDYEDFHARLRQSSLPPCSVTILPR